MIRNYLKTAFRNIARQKLTTLVNIFCLGIAVGCSIIAYLFTVSNFSTEASHVNGDRIFVVQHKAVADGDLATFGSSPVPLGPAMAADHGSIVNTVRIDYSWTKVVANDLESEDLIQFADPSFLSMFSFPLASGSANALFEHNSAILADYTAEKFFGDQDPIGKTLQITIGNEVRSFTVRGVAEKREGPSSCVSFSILVPYENRFTDVAKSTDWNTYTTATFIQVDNLGSLKGIQDQMERYVKLQNDSDNKNRPVKAFAFENLHDIRASADDVKNSIGGHIAWAPIIVLSFISLFLLMLACSNFINISLAIASNRLKEIGIRKVIGGNRNQVMIQFMIENLLVCIAAFIFAIAITGSLLLPGFENIASTGITMDLTERLDLWAYLFILLVAVAVASGMYPSYYISSFRPIAILRDKLQFGSKNRFMQSLLTVQFVIALITMMGSVGLTLNYIDMKNRDWGYDKDNTLTIKVKNADQYNALRKAALELPTVDKVTGAKTHVGHYEYTTSVSVNDDRASAIVFEVDKNYFETMGLKLQSGKLPQGADQVIINERFASRIVTPMLGESVTIDSADYAVTGVVTDFHHSSFEDDIESVVFRVVDESAFQTMIVKTEHGKGNVTREKLESTWKQLYPEQPFTASFQDKVFDEMYVETNGIVQIFLFTTVVALFMSCVGLFGLASQRLQFKMKELCIRKIFGVPVFRAIFIVNGNFLVLMGLAALIATPINYFMLGALLDSIYHYRMEIGALPFIVAYSLMLVTIMVTLSGKIRQIVVTNPAEVLRNE